MSGLVVIAIVLIVLAAALVIIGAIRRREVNNSLGELSREAKKADQSRRKAEVAGAALEQLLLDIETARKQPGSPRDRLLCFFGLVANRTAEAGPMRRELLTEIIYAGHEAGSGGEQARKLHDGFAAIVCEGIAAGDLSKDHSAETLTEMLMGAFYVLMFNWANLDAYPLERQAEAAARFLADAMTVQPQRNKRSRS